jgi:hypothetical protein
VVGIGGIANDLIQYVAETIPADPGVTPPNPSIKNPNLPPSNNVSAASRPQPGSEKILNRLQTRLFIARILGPKILRKRKLSEKDFRKLALLTNIIVNRKNSHSVTNITKAKILSNPTISATLKLAYQTLLSYISLKPVPLAGATTPATALDNLTASAVGNKAIDKTILKLFRRGTFYLELDFIHEKGKLAGFRVLLYSGWHQEVIAEYKDGKITKNPSGPISKAAVTYLQRLLWGAGYLDTKQYFTYGVFCKDTLNALYTFMSNKNLITAFNLKVSKHMFTSIVNEANLAYSQYSTYKGTSKVARSVRYEQAKRALSKLLRAIKLARRYIDIPQNNLSPDEKAFVQTCRSQIAILRKRTQQILLEIFNPKDEKARLFGLEIQIILTKLKAYKKARKEFMRTYRLYKRDPRGYNIDGKSHRSQYYAYRKKFLEAYNDVTNTLSGTLSPLRQWIALAQHDPALYEKIKKYIKASVNGLKTFISGFSSVQIGRHLDREIQLLDQRLMRQIESLSSLHKHDPRLRFERASRILTTSLGKKSSIDKFGNHPAKSIILSLIHSYVKQGKSLGSLRQHLRIFRALYHKTAHLNAVARMAQHYIRNNRRIALKGQGASSSMNADISQAIQDTVFGARRFGDFGSTFQNKVFNLAFSFYSFMQTYNNNAAAAGKPEIKITDLIHTTLTVIDKVSAEKDRIKGKIDQGALKKIAGSSYKARKILAALKKLGYIKQKNKNYYINIKVKLNRANFAKVNLGVKLSPDARNQILILLQKTKEGYVTRSGANQEILKTISLAMNTSDNIVVAKQELAEQLKAIRGKRIHVTFKRLMGGSKIVITPRAIRELEVQFRKTSAISGKISYKDLKRWGSSYLKGLKAQPGDWFFVSNLGVFKIPKGFPGIDKIPTIPTNNLAGTVIKRDALDLLKTEPIACIKLAIAPHVQISDAQVLKLSEKITARLKSQDLFGSVKVFSESKFWIIQPGTLSFLPIESKALGIVAGIIENKTPTSKIPTLLRKVSSGNSDIRFTREEKNLLRDFVNNFDISKYSHLSSIEQKGIRSAIRKLKSALNKLYHKGGLKTKQQNILLTLAIYLTLDPKASINDARFIRKKPAAALVARLSSTAGKLGNDHFERAYKLAIGILGKSFSKERFKKLYQASLLKLIYQDLQVLATKNPEEDRGFRTGSFKGWFGFLKQHYKRVWKAAGESVTPPSQESYFMTGLSNDMAITFNWILLKKELQPKLRRINAALAKLKPKIEGQIVKAVKDAPIVKSIAVFKVLYKKFGPMIKALRKKQKKLKDSSKLKRHMLAFLSLTTQLSQINKNPYTYLTNADYLSENIQHQLAKLKLAYQYETSSEKKLQYKKIINALESIYSALVILINLRNKIIPEFTKKSRLESDRNDIMYTLSNTRYDLKKLKLLKKIFHNKLYSTSISSNVLDRLSRVLTGQTRKVTGSGFKTTHKTIGQIIDLAIAYLEKPENRNKAIDVSNLTVQPGENRIIFNLKCALSKFFNETMREQTLNLPKALSAVLFGHGSSPFWVSAPAIASRGLNGAGEVTFGPQTYASLVSRENSAWSRLYYSSLSFLALASSGEQPPMNLSSQLYMITNGTTQGQIRLAQVFSKRSRKLHLSSIDFKTLKIFIDHIKEEIIPRLRNSRRLKQRLVYLLKTIKGNKAYIDLSKYIKNPDKLYRDFLFKYASLNYKKMDSKFKKKYTALKKQGETKEAKKLFNKWKKVLKNRYYSLLAQKKYDKAIKLVYNYNFKIYDSFHAKKRVKLSKLVETVLILTGEINQSRAMQDPENYAITYFDPIHSVQSASLKYNLPSGVNLAPPHKIGVIHYSADPKEGSLETSSWIETLWKDTKDWTKIYGKKALFGLISNIRNDFMGFTGDLITEGGGFALHFMKLMGHQIRMGFTATFGGLGDMFRGALKGDKDLMLAALDRISKGLAHTTGAFFAFEVLPAVFYMDVKAAIEEGDFNKAFGKALAITMMFAKGLRVTLDVIHYGIKKGWVTVLKGKGILIRNPEKLKAHYDKLAAKEQVLQMLKQRSVAGKLGIKLANYHLNPFAYVNLYRAMRTYSSGGLSIKISKSPIQINLVNKVKQSGRLMRIAEFGVGAKHALKMRWRGLARLWQISDNVRGMLARKNAGTKLDPVTALIARNLTVGSNTQVRIGSDTMAAKDLPTYLQRLTLEVAQGARDASVFDSKIILSENQSIKIGDLINYQQTETTLKQLWENPNLEFDMAYDKPYKKGRSKGQPLGQIRMTGAIFQQLVRAKANGEKGKFRRLIKRHNLISGAEYNNSSITQLWNAFEGYANTYKQIKTSVLASITPANTTKAFNAAKFLRNATIGKGLGNTYTLDLIDPQTGKPIVDPRTNKPYEVKGRQILEVLYNASKPKFRSTISEKAVAMLREHFGKKVPGLDMHHEVKRAGRRYLRGYTTRTKFAGVSYVRQKQDGGRIRKFLRKTFGTYKFGKPRYRSWKDIYKKLEGSTLVNNYAKHFEKQFKVKLKMSTARKILAHKIFDNYVDVRTAIVMETLEAVAKDVLSPRQYAHFKKRGALKRGFIFRRYFQKVNRSKQFKKELTIKLKVLDTGAENLGREIDNIMRREGIENPIFIYRDLANTINGRLAGFGKVAETASTRIFSVSDPTTGKRFGWIRFEEINGKMTARYKLKDPKKTKLTAAEHTNFVKVQEAAYLEGVRNLARTQGIPEHKLAEFKSMNDLVRLIQKADLSLAARIHKDSATILSNIESLIKDYNAGEIKDPKLRKRVKKFIKWMKKHANKTRNNMIKMSARSIIVGFITIVGMEKIADWIGIKNPIARLGFILGPTHVISQTAEKFLTVKGARGAWASITSFSRTMLKPPPELVKLGRAPRLRYITSGLGKLNWIGGTGTLIKGLGQAVVVSHAFNGFLDVMGISNKSVLRNPLVNLGAVFVLQTGISLAYQLAMSRIAAQALATGLATTAEGAASIAAASKLGIAGRILGPAATALGLCNFVDSLIWPQSNTFKGILMQVNHKATMSHLKKNHKGTWVLGKVGGFFFPGKVRSQTWEYAHPIRDKTIEKYMGQSKLTRNKIKALFAGLLMTKVYSRYRGQSAQASFFTNASVNQNGVHLTRDSYYLKYVESLARGKSHVHDAKLTKSFRSAIKFLRWVDPASVMMVRPDDPQNNDDIRSMFSSGNVLKETRYGKNSLGQKICLTKPQVAHRKAFYNWIKPANSSQVIASRKSARIAYLLNIQANFGRVLALVLKTKGQVPPKIHPAAKRAYIQIKAQLTKMGINPNSENPIVLKEKQINTVLSKMLLANSHITSVDKTMKFVNSDGLINTKHVQYVGIMQNSVRQKFAAMDKAKRKAAVEGMFAAVYLSDTSNLSAQEQNIVAQMRQTLIWLGYKVPARVKKQLATLGSKIRSITKKIKSKRSSNKTALYVELIKIKQTVSKIIKKHTPANTSVMDQARLQKWRAEKYSRIIQRERAKEQLKPLTKEESIIKYRQIRTGVAAV